VTHDPDINSVARVCQPQLGFLVESLATTMGYTMTKWKFGDFWTTLRQLVGAMMSYGNW